MAGDAICRRRSNARRGPKGAGEARRRVRYNTRRAHKKQALLGAEGGATFADSTELDKLEAECVGGVTETKGHGRRGPGSTVLRGASTGRGRRPRLTGWWSMATIVMAVIISMVKAVEGRAVALFAVSLGGRDDVTRA